MLDAFRRGPRSFRIVLLAAVTGLASGCATYTDNLADASLAAYSGSYGSAVESVNGFIGVRKTEELPTSWGADAALGTLERGVLQQALGSYDGSRRDFSAAEERLETLELTRDPVGTLGGYLYSDSSKPYLAPPSERLALNALNLLNYLVKGDLDGAAIEARRFQVMREYLKAEGISEHGAATLGTYLAGFVFERLGEGDRALRYYEESLGAAQLESLRRPVSRLARGNAYRGPNLNNLLARSATSTGRPNEGEILVVVSTGRVSHKVPERLPVGAAIGLAGTYLTGDYRWLTRGGTKVVVYPELKSTPSSLPGRPALRINGQSEPVEQVIDFDAAVRREYEEMKPKILAAAITRLATRAAVSEGVRAAGNKQGDVLGELLGIAIEGALVAADKPDTRSWTMLPARVAVARIPVAAGTHQIEIDVAGSPSARRTETVKVPANGFATVVVTEPR